MTQSPWLAAFALGVALSLAAPALAQDSVDIRFEPGASGATINGTIVGDEYIDYVLNARGGQRMTVSLTVTGTNGNGSAYFNILPAGQDFPALFNGSSEGRQAEVTLPSSGGWAIRVYLMGNDRDTGRTVGYSIDVAIAPEGASSAGSGGTSGGLLPEEDLFIVSLSDPNGRLNVRNAPRPSGTLVGTIANGATVGNVGGCTMSDGQQWCEVQATGGGVRGWVAARYLRLPGDENSATADDGGGAMAGASRGSVDEAACLAAVRERSASSNPMVLSYETSEANNLAMIRDDFGVTWRCLVNGGAVVELDPQ